MCRCLYRYVVHIYIYRLIDIYNTLCSKFVRSVLLLLLICQVNMCIFFTRDLRFSSTTPLQQHSLSWLLRRRCGKTYGHLWTSGFPFRKIICPRGIYLLHCLLMTLEMPLLVLWPCTEDLQWLTTSM